uniref:Dolichol-phosphate mannosyltransferase subunit 1 n=1 Tax=Chlamydomonas euryale TaxID=1486919 RepID=A0A6U2JBC8_9CHLO|mmetsp:Transcript_5993/g.18476  ORF Transcript_5993/g.18476 Transcript_5993/m.18476 type:complete len:249 (+) Transcript_5993:327-1073(+)
MAPPRTSVGAPALSIIVPTYNEAANLPLLAWLLNRHLSTPPATVDFELVVVDDSSPDGTAAVAEHLAAALPQLLLKVVSRPGKLGLGSAYIEGLKAARGQLVLLMDADLSHHPKYIPLFLEKQRATGCDIVTGTRYRAGGGVAGWTLSRKVVSRGANIMASFLLGATTSDLTGSFRLYRRSVLESLLQVSTSSGYAFQMEVIVRAQYAKHSIAEVPIVFVDRVLGESKLGANEVVLFVRGLFKLLATL